MEVRAAARGEWDCAGICSTCEWGDRECGGPVVPVGDEHWPGDREKDDIEETRGGKYDVGEDGRPEGDVAPTGERTPTGNGDGKDL